jgi:hypothetical protein
MSTLLDSILQKATALTISAEAVASIGAVAVAIPIVGSTATVARVIDTGVFVTLLCNT